MSFYKEVPGLETTLESTLKFDTEPKAGSTNPVTSDGVKTAIDGAVGDAAEALQEQIDDISEMAGSGYTPKGEATVATLNGLSGQENGWLYTLTDAGTLTDGSLAVVAGDTVAWDATNEVWYKAMDYAPRQYGTNEVHNLPTSITAFRTGDVIPVDGPSGTAKMSKDDLLRMTAENAHDNGLLQVMTPQIYAHASSNLGDLNNAEPNSVYIISRDNSTTTLNFPSDFKGEGELTTHKSGIPGGSHYFIFQVLKKFNTSGYWWRKYNSVNTTWTNWEFERDLFVADNFIIGTRSTNPSSLNDLKDNGIYQTIYSTTISTTDFPSDCAVGHRGILNVYRSIIDNGGTIQVEQSFSEISTGKSWWRYWDSNSSQWSAWKANAGVRNTIEIGQGKTFTTFRAGMEYAFDQGNVDVIVYPGIYDLETEFSDVLPTYSGTSFFGCKIGNGIHLKFMAGAEVHAIIDADKYPTNIDKIRKYFEPISFKHKSGGSDDFVIENAVIKSRNTRYCVHDDDGSISYPCVHKFINCRMYRENEPGIGSTNNYIQCLGGGLGNHTIVVVEGGYYETKTYIGVSSINNGDVDYAQICVSYHNVGSSVVDAESKIFVRDVYFANRGYFMVQSYGSSEVTSKIYINGCRFGLHPLVWFGGGDSSITNVELCAYWNCTEAEEGDWSTTTSPISATYVPSN